jgi:uncharacterized membrane protein YkoI
MRPLAAAVCSLLVLGIVAGPSAAAARAVAPADGADARAERADGGTAPSRRTGAGAHAGAVSLDRAVEMVQRRYDAKVVRAEETREGDDVVYRIRLLSADGRVFTVRVNARTGQID